MAAANHLVSCGFCFFPFRNEGISAFIIKLFRITAFPLLELGKDVREDEGLICDDLYCCLDALSWYSWALLWHLLKFIQFKIYSLTEFCTAVDVLLVSAPLHPNIRIWGQLLTYLCLSWAFWYIHDMNMTWLILFIWLFADFPNQKKRQNKMCSGCSFIKL